MAKKANMKQEEWDCPFLGHVVAEEQQDGSWSSVFEMDGSVAHAVKEVCLQRGISEPADIVLQKLVLDYAKRESLDAGLDNPALSCEERCLRLVARWKEGFRRECIH